MRLDARNLDIAALRPYLASHLNATLAKAELSGRGNVALAKASGDAPLKLAYTGSARLSNVHLLDGTGESDLLKWQVLDVDGIDVKAGEGIPFASLGKVTLSDFYARVILSDQGRLNLADLIRKEARRPSMPNPGMRRSLPSQRPAQRTARHRPLLSRPGPPTRRRAPTIRIGRSTSCAAT